MKWEQIKKVSSGIFAAGAGGKEDLEEVDLTATIAFSFQQQVQSARFVQLLLA